MSDIQPKNINGYLVKYVIGHIVVSIILFVLAVVLQEDAIKDVGSFAVVQIIICFMTISLFKITDNHSSKWKMKN